MRSFLEEVTRGAEGVYRRPALAGTLYALALVGVLAAPLVGGPSGPSAAARGTRRGVAGAAPVGPPAGAPPPEALLLREIEGAGLRVTERRYRAGDAVWAPGDPDDRLLFVVSGVVRVYRTYGAEHKEATTDVLKDGGLLGGPDLSGSGHREDFAEAATEALVVAVRKAAVEWLVRRRPEAALPLLSASSERMRRSEELAAILAPREVSARLAALLLRLGERFGEEVARDGPPGEPLRGAVEIGLRLPHRELASMVASTREAVSKVVSDFRRAGLAEARNQRVVLLDLRGLRDVAQGKAGAGA